MRHRAVAAKSALAKTASVKNLVVPVTPAAIAPVQHHAAQQVNAAQRVIVVPSSLGAVGDFGRSSLPRRTSRQAATSEQQD